MTIVQIATWNVNSLRARMPRVLPWIEQNQPDVLCLQETKLKDESFMHDEFEKLGYECAHFGFNHFNGVAIVSKVGLDKVERGFGDQSDHRSEGRIITATCGGVRVSSVYVPNGRALDDPHYTWKLSWLDELADFIDRDNQSENAVICGDFNVAPTDDDIWDPACFVNRTHASVPERDRVNNLKNKGLTDLYRVLNPTGPGEYTWWDYRELSFPKGRGLRIDLFMGGKKIVDALKTFYVDRDARKGEKPSDHAPVVIDIDWPL